MPSLRRAPVHVYNGVHRALAALGRSPPRFADLEETLHRDAREATGLDDFGDPAYLDGLHVLLRAYDEEAHLTPFGRMMVTRELTGVLSARLAVEAGWKADPSLREAPIRRPLFILGLPRTGTTALHHLLAQDPDSQVLEFFLAVAPGPRPPRETWPDDPRYRASERGLRTAYFLDPSLKAIHLLTTDGPEECRHLLGQSFSDDTFDSNATVPSYTAWYRERDMRASYARHRDILRLIQAPTPGRRWVLKYPAHLTHLEVLFETYPDACIVQTHRDPSRVLPSLCSLVTHWRGLYEEGVDARAVARWQLEMWAERMEHAMAVRAQQKPEQFFDLDFREVVDDPVAAVRRVSDHFGFELSGEAERRMRSWHAEHPQGEHGGHRYSAAQFGLVEDEMAGRFAAYVEHFDVKREASL